ncbi:TolC family protein [Sulfuricaulis limicola]|uniref:TolC family protein n=1 Tax=Sulfuricaulis limicola TaxID=1620215 RepID=UPI0015537867|nr:TolC family protein [Sulfuricaulis limicola]
MTLAQDDIWSLESAIQRALEIAPEMRAAEADAQALQGELTQVGSWPNPTIDLRADDRLGQEDGRGGTDFTQLALSQPLPLRRVARERAVAESRLAGAEENRRLRRLELERATAQAFHDLQLAQARLDVAQARLKETEGYPGGAKGARDRLVRYLAPLERARLAILREETNQAVIAAEREREQALIAFRARLALPADAAAETTPFGEPPTPAALETLARNLDNHPALAAARKEYEAAEANIAAAQSQRFADPALNLFRERDILAGARRDVTGVGLSVQVPLWNTNPGIVDKARAEALGARTDYEITAREARVRLDQAYTELTRALVQVQRLRVSLLEPAQRLNDLARRSFAAGEASVLALIDAANSYFDAQTRYVELLARAQAAQAGLRLAAGQSLLSGEGRP